MINSLGSIAQKATILPLRAVSVPVPGISSTSPDSVQIDGAKDRPCGKSVGQSLWSAAKWAAVGGVVCAVPFLGFFASAIGGAMAADKIFGSKEHHSTPLLLGATAGVATHVIPMAGLFVAGMAFLPATVIFGAATAGYLAFQHARGKF